MANSKHDDPAGRGNRMTPEDKKWIDAASYEEMLRLWRFAPVGYPLFQDDDGRYFLDVMRRKKEETGDNGVSASSGACMARYDRLVAKAMGWETD